MRIATWVLVIPCSILLSVPAANAFDLTGHWEGKWTCKGFDGVKFTDVNKTATLAITQSGNAFTAEEDGSLFYAGAAIPDAKKPDEKGEVVLIACNTNTSFTLGDGDSEIIRASVKTKIGSPKATLNGTGILENNLVPFGQEIQTCKYSYKRKDTMDPGLVGCPL